MGSGRKVRVAVEGNIGCGKSTFLKYFGDFSPNIQILPEPITLWNDMNGFKLFEVFYANPSQWSTAFQSQVMVTMLSRQAEKQVAPVRLLERSVHSIRYIFVEALNRNGHLSDEDLGVFDKFCSWSFNLPSSELDLIVYLRCSPEDYLNQLHDLHEEWLLGSKLETPRAPVLIFDCDKPLETLVETYFERKDQVLCGVTV